MYREVYDYDLWFQSKMKLSLIWRWQVINFFLSKGETISMKMSNPAPEKKFKKRKLEAIFLKEKFERNQN